MLITFVALQRSFIYHPGPPGKASPADYGVAFEEVKFPSSDGVEISAWWLEHKDRKHSPVLFYCHGNGAVLSSLAQVSSIFFNFGWDVLLFDYRMYGKSGQGNGKLSEELLQRDAESGYQWLIQRGTAESRIVVWGHSLGSSVAALLASRHRPAGLFLEGSFPSMFAMARERYPEILVPPFLIFDRFATAEYLRQHSFPVMVLHASQDEVIPLTMGERVLEAISEPKRWVMIDGIGHNDFPAVIHSYRDLLVGSVKEWIERASEAEKPSPASLEIG
ncbi:MAG: alpha/beta hydrolase [Oligoflexia bacterium]|nr:alpha/beta hydrolase [Oligoflexia bacterium]